jgi:hypothetical protein
MLVLGASGGLYAGEGDGEGERLEAEGERLEAEGERLEAEGERLEAAGIEHRGVWMVKGEARAFVAVSPWPRVLRYLPHPGVEPMLKLGTRPHDTGIRTWFMEDDQQTTHSYRPAGQPADILERGEASVYLRSRWTGKPGFETAVMMRVELLADGSLRIRHGVQNMAPQRRNLAVWSITAFPVGGVIEMEFARPKVRTLALFSDTTLADLAVVLEEDRLRIDTAAVQADDRAVKFGVLGKSGEISHKVNGQIWTSHVPFSDIGPYPDGGSNLTAFVSSRKPGDGAWAEIEQVGVARWLEHGESVWLEETITRVDIPNPSSTLNTHPEMKSKL